MANNEDNPEVALSATEFLSKLAAQLLTESDDKDVAKILAHMIADGLPVDDVIAKLNELAAARCIEASSGHE